MRNIGLSSSHSTIHSSSKAPMALLDRKNLEIDLTESVTALITGRFEREVIPHLVNRIGSFRVFAANTSYELFSSSLGKHALNLGVSYSILQNLNDSYQVMSSSPLSVQAHFVFLAR